jgi:hypothetical protein
MQQEDGAGLCPLDGPSAATEKSQDKERTIAAGLPLFLDHHVVALTRLDCALREEMELYRAQIFLL